MSETLVEDEKVMAEITGEKGKKGAIKNGDDTLESTTTAIVIDAISEGPIVGLVDGNNSIFLNKTPVSNYEGVTYQTRRGLPDDTPVNGVTGTEAMVSVGVTFKQPGQVNQAPIRTVADTTADVVRIYIDLNSLYFTSKKGAVKVAYGGWRVFVRPAGGSWQQMVNKELHDKVTSPVQFQHDIRLPGIGPWDIRVEAILPDRSEDKAYETLTWQSYSVVTEAKLSYPHTAVMALRMDAEHVGNSVHERIYHVKGRLIKVPVNYDPVTRAYSGSWNGAFKVAYSNNPAWVLYDAITNNIFGIGNEVSSELSNKWQLYTIAQYCDGMVPSGYKNALGDNIMEPRYTFNGVIQDKKQAFDLINQLTAVFRGMGFYSLSQFHVTADMPVDPVRAYGPANVVDGRFEYTTSSTKARHTVVLVRFNDMNNFYGPAIEPVIDDKGVHELGWREKTLELIGCSSRSLARRYGKWVLDTEANETETVTFKVGMDSINALPGEVIAINDPRRAEVRLAGRIESVTAGSTINLDQTLDSRINRTQVRIWVTKKDGTIFTRLANVQANFQSVNIGSGNATADLVGCSYVISPVNVVARQYRIVSIDEIDEGRSYQITALQYDRNKFARVEQGIVFEPEPTVIGRNIVNAPTNLTLNPISYTEGGRVRTDIEIGWTAPLDTLVRHYEVTVGAPDSNGRRLDPTTMNSRTFTTYEAGRHWVSVAAVNSAGRRSAALTGAVVINGPEQLGVGEVQGLVNAVTGTAGPGFTGKDARIRWRNMMRVSSNPAEPLVENDPATYSHSTVRVYSGTTLLREQQIRGSSYTYTWEMNDKDARDKAFASARRHLRFEVTLTNQDGQQSLPALLNLSNPVPAMIVPRLTSDGAHIRVEWDNPKDADLQGVKVWVETNDTFDPYVILPKYDGMAGFYTFKGVPTTGYYVRVAGYDAFGEDGLNISAPALISTGRDVFDDEPPPTPTGLVLSSAVDTDGKVTLNANWTGSPALDILGYDVEIREGSTGNYVSNPTRPNSYSWRDVKPATSYTVRVRARDLSNNNSNFSLEATHTTVRDTVPPAQPTGLKATGTFEAIWLEWNRNTESDFSHYEVAVGTASNPTTIIARPSSSTVSITGLPANALRYIRVRAVDYSGNTSTWTGTVTATTKGEIDFSINNEDLRGLVDATSFDGSVEPVRIWTGAALPATKQTTTIAWNGKLYRWNGTAYAPDILGQDAVLAANIKAGAVSAEAMAIGFGGNFIQNSSFAGDNSLGWRMVGTGLISETTLGVRTSAGTWSGADYPTLMMEQLGTETTGYADLRYLGISSVTGTFGFGFPVKPGEWLEASVNLSTHRCTAELRIEWRRTDNTVISYAAPTMIPTVQGSNSNPDEWPRYWVKGRAPAEAAYAVMHIRKLGTLSLTSSYVFVHKPMLTFSGEFRTEPTPYANGSFTYIDGNTILTDTVKARSIDVRDLAVTGLTNLNVAFIKEAHISGKLNASILEAGTALAGSITVAGTALETVRARSDDPANRINNASTRINPGRIRLTGATSLTNWIMGGDETRINGGQISANTIKANSLEIGSRNVSLTNIEFEHNSPNTNYVSWTGGFIRYVDDAGNDVARAIPADQAQWTSGVVYIYWIKGETQFRTTTTQATAWGSDRMTIATYEGGRKLDADYGRTVVDGASLKTGTVTATQLIKTAALITEEAQLGNATVDTLKIKGNAVTIPIYVYASATIDQVDTETQFITGWIPRAGYSTLIQCYLSVGSYNDSIFNVTLYRGGTAIQTFAQTIAGWNGSRISANFVFVDTDTGSGATQYRMTAKRASGGNLKIEQRSLILHQFKR